MHDIDRTMTEIEPEMDEFETDEFETDQFEFEGETDLESPFDEVEEMDYAAELLSIQSEEELDQFLGKLIKRAGRGLSKIGKVFRPLGGVLKGLAKKALPFVGGALGSFIPIPGVGTAVGTALGSAVSKALEAEFEGLDPEDQEFEMAKRFVRVAGAAVKQAANAGSDADPQAAVKSAVVAAARRHVPNLSNVTRNGAAQSGAGASGRRSSGRWIRRGRKIVLLGV
jgi:uncharacterized protein (DUF697 family)